MTFDAASPGPASSPRAITGDVAARSSPRAGRDARGRAARARQRQPPRRRLRAAGRERAARRRGRARAAHRAQRRRLCCRRAPPATAGVHGVVSARTTITSVAARTATRSPRKGEDGPIHSGADDNASGVAAVLEAGAAPGGAERGDRDVVLAFWSGEELGLLGSTDFVAGGRSPLDSIAAYLNFDMVGRMRDNSSAPGRGSSPAWRAADRAGERARPGSISQLQEDPYLPTDSAFYRRRRARPQLLHGQPRGLPSADRPPDSSTTRTWRASPTSPRSVGRRLDRRCRAARYVKVERRASEARTATRCAPTPARFRTTPPRSRAAARRRHRRRPGRPGRPARAT